MSATFDTTTKAAYDAATTAQSRAEAIVASLTGTISVKVFNGSNTEMGSGTMAAPWATAVAGAVVLGEVSSFTVGTTGTPDANWYIRFQNADVSRWARGSFGLSGADYNWSLATWESGQTGTIGTATIVAAGNEAPVFSVAPTVASLGPTGGTVQFTATDPEGGEVFYSLTTTRSGITINASSGLVTVTAAAAGTSGNIVVQASDGILTTSATCVVTVADSVDRKWTPGHYVKTQGSDSGDPATYWSSVQTGLNRSTESSVLVGNFVTIAWGEINPTGSTFSRTRLDALLDWSVANDKKVILSVSYKNNAPSSPGLIGPSDLISSDAVTNSTGWIMCLWRSAVMDRYIAAMNWLAANYDYHPALELVTTSESAPSTPASGSGYSVPALSAQLRRLYTAQGAAFVNTFVVINMNFLGDQAAPLVEAGFQAGLGHGTPDAFDDTGNKIFRGVQVVGAGTTVRDYRGRVPHNGVASSPVLGGKDDNGPATNIINWSQANSVTHLAWVTTVGTTGNTWTDIKAAIAADPSLYTTFPAG